MKRLPKKLSHKPEAWLLILALIGAITGSLATYGREAADRASTGSPPGITLAQSSPDEEAWRIQDEENTVQVFEAAIRGVVMVTTYGSSGRSGPDTSGLSRLGNGSGFFIDSEGHIVTNNHVVEEATSVEVRTYSGQVLPATVVGTDRLTDLAVLSVDIPEEEVYPLTLADYSQVRVGQKAIVLGSPMATGSDMGLDRSSSVTTGIISAKDRSLPIESVTRPGVNDFTVENLIQTDAAVNPGNSGGPLLNSKGEVVGVVTAILDSASGIGFAIPSEVVYQVVPQILQTGSMTWAFMGVSYYPIDALLEGLDSQSIAKLDLGVTEGALVTDVNQDGPADKAGIKGSLRTVTIDGEDYPAGGDIIASMDGTPVRGSDLSSLITRHKPGDKVVLDIIRDGKHLTVEVVLGSR